ncbi:MAG: hypothetical protein HY814_15640 [Candidatus Riflebacteria bacterium]|nr:hypothetical protein [Candidatus Riflebacteria bacterium]
MPHPLAALAPLAHGVRLLAADIDDTMTRSGKFSAAVLGRLESLAARGLPLVLVTGRPAGVAMGLLDYLPGVVAAISENGGCLCGPGGTRILPSEVVGPEQLRANLDACVREIRAAVPRARPTACCFARLTDATFEVDSVTDADRLVVDAVARRHGLTTAASSIHLHLKSPGHDKGRALTSWLAEQRPPVRATQVVTCGDSLTDASLFDPAVFPLSVGVANVALVLDRLVSGPAYITEQPEAAGFVEVVDLLLAAPGV